MPATKQVTQRLSGHLRRKRKRWMEASNTAELWRHAAAGWKFSNAVWTQKLQSFSWAVLFSLSGTRRRHFFSFSPFWWRRVAVLYLFNKMSCKSQTLAHGIFSAQEISQCLRWQSYPSFKHLPSRCGLVGTFFKVKQWLFFFFFK